VHEGRADSDISVLSLGLMQFTRFSGELEMVVSQFGKHVIVIGVT